MSAPDGRSPEGRRASPALAATMAGLSAEVAKMASRLMADALTLTRIAGALSVGDRLVFGRLKRYVTNGQAAAEQVSKMLDLLESVAASSDPDFLRRRKAQQRQQGRDKEKWEAWGQSLRSLGLKVHDQMIEAEFPGMSWGDGEERWQAKYGGMNAERLLAAYVVQRSAKLAELQQRVSEKLDDFVQDLRSQKSDDDPAGGNVVPFDRGKLH